MQAYCFVLLLSPFWPFFAKSGRPPRGASQGTKHGCQLHFQSPHSILVYPTCVSSSITQVIAWKSILPASNGATKSTKPSVSAESRTLTKLMVPEWAAPGQVGGLGRVTGPLSVPTLYFVTSTEAPPEESHTVSFSQTAARLCPKLRQKGSKGSGGEDGSQCSAGPCVPFYSSPARVAWPLGDPGSSTEIFSFPLWSFIYFFKPSSHVFISGKEFGFVLV